MKYTRKQLQKWQKKLKKLFQNSEMHFLKTHSVKDEKEFTERYKNKLAKNNSKQK